MALLNEAQLELFALLVQLAPGGDGDGQLAAGPTPDADARPGSTGQDAGTWPATGATAAGPAGTTAAPPGSAGITIQIRNDSGAPLSLKLQSADGGQFTSAPPASVAVDATGEFTFAAAQPGKDATGGLQWSVGDSGAIWSIDWDLLPRGDSVGRMTLSPATANLGMDSHTGKEGSQQPMSFTLFRRDGPSPAVMSCVVEVRNASRMPLTLRAKSTGGNGTFASEPPGTLAPGASGSFQYVGDPGAPSVSGTVSWDLGDTGSTWTTGWFLSPRDGNSAEASAEPPRPGFNSEGTIAAGSTGVPVQFTLTGNEAPTTPAVNALVEIRNDSGVPLSLKAQSAKGGAFTGGPPATVAVGDTGRFRLAGEPGALNVQGALQWTVGESDTVWVMDWTLSARGGGSGMATLQSPQPDLGMDDDIGTGGAGGPDVPVIFTLFNRKGPALPLSATITVKNDSKLPLTLRAKSTGGGTFTSQPSGTLTPGASTQFEYQGDAGAPRLSGTVSWNVGDTGSTWDNLWTVSPRDGNTADAAVSPALPGTASGASTHKDQFAKVPVSFTLEGGTAPSAPSMSGVVSVHNQSGMPLTLKEQSTLGGHFVTAPPANVASGDTAQFRFAGEAGVLAATGTLVWDVGDGKARWSMDWKLSQREGSSTATSFGPDQPGMEFHGTLGTGTSDVPIDFELVNTAPPVPPDPPEDDFTPPTASKQPTLHKGDQSPDGWVEYAQRLLIKHKLSVTVNGNFDGAMEKQVKLFQQQKGCQVDGVIGNQTWSMLREAPKEAVGTDGRAAHSFEQKDAQARFVTERPDSTGYAASEDRYFMLLVSVGEQSIEGKAVTVRVIQPDQTAHTHKLAIGPATDSSPDGQGNYHKLEIPSFRKEFKIPDGVDPLTCTVDAYLDADLGGDRFTGPVTAAS